MTTPAWVVRRYMRLQRQSSECFRAMMVEQDQQTAERLRLQGGRHSDDAVALLSEWD